MGLGFTIDSPVKVAPFGISSVISIVDDNLIEKMRKYYCDKYSLPYSPITDKIKDKRAERITRYLNLIDEVVQKKIASLKNSFAEKGSELQKYFDMLPDFSYLKQKYYELIESKNELQNDLKEWIIKNVTAVNIMTKLDTENIFDKEKLPSEFNDAHAALRGFANSNLNSSIVLSAGMNPKLYSYMENFEDFYPDENNNLKKKIIIKVSDFRSALIQGKFMAKKGLWISEYRIESGLNCGGHAFATDGYLMGPILEEFKEKRNYLIESTFDLYKATLKNKGRYYPESPYKLKITAQGGVGTSDEHQFLLQHYELDSVGWGTPFLLVPEAVSIDTDTIELLKNAGENDLYLSNISPLGVPFNSIRNNTQDLEKQQLIDKGRPGSACPKKYLAFNKEFTEESICTASRQYQFLKLKDIESKELNIDDQKKEFDKIVDKACLCVGLANSPIISNNLELKGNNKGVSVCPGPNMAYFNKILSLKEMVDHIYGRKNVIDGNERPNMFLKELKLYIDYLRNMVAEAANPLPDKQAKYFLTFRENLEKGIEYYGNLFSEYKIKFENMKEGIIEDLENLRAELESIELPSLVQV